LDINKAIEIEQRTGEAFLQTDPEDIDEADRLSIEALKRVLKSRPPHPSLAFLPLPGENSVLPHNTKAEEYRRLLESPLGKEPGVK